MYSQKFITQEESTTLCTVRNSLHTRRVQLYVQSEIHYTAGGYNSMYSQKFITQEESTTLYSQKFIIHFIFLLNMSLNLTETPAGSRILRS